MASSKPNSDGLQPKSIGLQLKAIWSFQSGRKTVTLRREMENEKTADDAVEADIPSPTMAEAVEFLGKLTFQRLQELAEYSFGCNDTKAFTLRRFYLCAGDVIFLPAGTITLEKAVTGHSIGIRSCSLLFNVRECMQSLAICETSEQKCLGHVTVV